MSALERTCPSAKAETTFAGFTLKTRFPTQASVTGQLVGRENTATEGSRRRLNRETLKVVEG